VTHDPDGREFPDLAAARVEAIKGVRSIISFEVLDGLIDLTGRIEVADSEGRVVLSIPYLEAVGLRVP
jgi:hypothetical protein